MGRRITIPRGASARVVSPPAAFWVPTEVGATEIIDAGVASSVSIVGGVLQGALSTGASGYAGFAWPLDELRTQEGVAIDPTLSLSIEAWIEEVVEAAFDNTVEILALLTDGVDPSTWTAIGAGIQQKNLSGYYGPVEHGATPSAGSGRLTNGRGRAVLHITAEDAPPYNPAVLAYGEIMAADNTPDSHRRTADDAITPTHLFLGFRRNSNGLACSPEYAIKFVISPQWRT